MNIYNKCINDKIIHKTIDTNKFGQMYHYDNFNNIDMKLRFFSTLLYYMFI